MLAEAGGEWLPPSGFSVGRLVARLPLLLTCHLGRGPGPLWACVLTRRWGEPKPQEKLRIPGQEAYTALWVV